MRVCQQVYGVDFSVDAKRAGKQVWIAHGTVEENQLCVNSTRCAYDWFESNPTNRDETLDELVEFVREQDSRVAIGLDFPFGLPAKFLDSDWVEFVKGFPSCFGDGVQTPDGLYNLVKECTKSEADLTRKTDEEEGARPAIGWFMRHLTFHGIHKVLKPLVSSESASIRPMHNVGGDVPVVLEIYPAATLRHHGLEDDGYKDVNETSWNKRRVNVQGLETDDISIKANAQRRAVCNDDALDSIVAAVATFRNLDPDIPSGDQYLKEGYIYA